MKTTFLFHHIPAAALSRRLSMSIRALLGVAALGLLLASPLSAVNWNGANGTWSTASNWTGGVVPANGSSLAFAGGNLSMNNDLPGASFIGISFNNSGNWFTFNGNALTLTGSTILSAAGLGGGGAQNTFNTAITLSGNITHTINPGNFQTMVFNGNISGSGSADGLTIVSSTVSGATYLRGNNTYTGATTITSGTTNVDGAAGTINASSSVSVSGSGATLSLNNSSGSVDRIKDTATLTLGGTTIGGTLNFTGNNTTSTTETIGTLAFDKGASVITLTSGATSGQLSTLSAASVSRVNNATAIIRGTNLQTASSNATRVLIGGPSGTGLTLVGNGTAAVGTSTAGTDKTLSIIPYFVGDTTAAGTGSGFLTYDTTAGTGGGLRPLATGEYNTLIAGYTTPGTVENVKAGSSNVTISTSSDVTVNSLLFSTATQTLNGSGGKLIVNSGAVAATANTQVIGGGFSGLTLGNGVWNEGIVTPTSGMTLTINTPIDVTGSGGLTKGGTGTLVLGASNLYTGQTTVNAGTLQIGTGTAGDLGSNSAGIVLVTGTLSFGRTNAGLTIANSISGSGNVTQNGSGGTTVLTGNSTYTGGTTITAGTLQIGAGTDSGSITGAITNNGALVYNVGAGTRTQTGVISGNGSLTQNSSGGIVTLSGSNTYNGTTTVSAGTLQFAKTASLYTGNATLWTAANIKVASGATLAVNVGGTGEFSTGNVTTLLTNLGGANGSSTAGFASGSNIGFNTTTASGGTFTVANNIADSTGSGGGAIGVTKLGSNTLVLSGTNAYTGTTTISAGTLLIASGGSLASGSAVGLNAGTFGGAGTVNGPVNVAASATLQAGVSLADNATFNLTNNVNLAIGSIVSLGLGASGAHDTLNLTGGTVTFDPAQSFLFLDQGAAPGLYTSIITGLGSAPVVTGWTVANGWTGVFSVNGNNVDFTLTAVPEPSTWVLVGIGLTFLLHRKRRRFDS